jgi:uncharacterized protein YecE (DUF72 family)
MNDVSPPGARTSEIRIGVAGWSYKDWEGIVYPEQLRRKQHPVEYLAQYLDLIEINTSFYGHIRPEWGRLWCRKARSVNPRFCFTAKLNQAFTHSPSAAVEATSAATIKPNAEAEKLAKEGLDAIAGEGALGALLIQFPVSFKNTNENRDYLDWLLTRFRSYPLAVEVRHSSWNNEGILRYFSEKGVSFVNIDQPRLGKSLSGTEHVTGVLAYIRLHGRNYDQWFEADRCEDRYNYLYRENELAGWKGKIENVAQKAEITFVVANNHFQGKAAVNALQLKHMVTGRPVKAPDILVQHYRAELEPVQAIVSGQGLPSQPTLLP